MTIPSGQFSDWTLGGGSQQPVAGDTIAVSTPYRNVTGNQQDTTTTYVFSVQAGLTPGKTVASITLPTATRGDAHAFAIGSDHSTADAKAQFEHLQIPRAPIFAVPPGHVVVPSQRP